MTFDVKAQVYIDTTFSWKDFFELFCVCRNCFRSTTFIVSLEDYNARPNFQAANALVDFKHSLNYHFSVERYVSVLDKVGVKSPDHVPVDIAAAFNEGASCFKIKCFNAAGAMFRLCVDLATRPLLPSPGDSEVVQPNEKERRDLGLRLKWLFDNNKLPKELAPLAKCIREDGNDGAHAGSLTETDGDDLQDFTVALLERLYTEPKKLLLAEQRRADRRKK